MSDAFELFLRPATRFWKSSFTKTAQPTGRRKSWSDLHESVGGFRAVRSEIADDMALARRFKEEKKRVVFADGFRIASCRMYRSTREVWEGFSKNIFEGMGASALVLLVVIFLYLGTFVVPYAAVVTLAVVGQTAGIWWWPALGGVAANILLRALMALRFR